VEDELFRVNFDLKLPHYIVFPSFLIEYMIFTYFSLFQLLFDSVVSA